MFERVCEITFIIEGIYIIAIPHTGSTSVKAGFPLADIFRAKRFFVLSYELSDETS